MKIKRFNEGGGCAGGSGTGTAGSGDVGFILASKVKKSEMGNPSEVSDARLIKKAKTNKVKDFKTFNRDNDTPDI